MNCLADLIGEEAAEALDEVGCGRNELAVRCTSRLHHDLFFYVTLAVLTSQAEGEIIGSGPCGAHVTKSFALSHLAQQHCRLRYEALSGAYCLQDLRSAEGTWVQFPVQLCSSPLLPGLELSLGPHRFRLEQGERVDVWQEVMKKYGLTAVVTELRHRFSLEDIGSLGVEELPISPANQRLMKQALSELQTLPTAIHSLQFVSSSSRFQLGLLDILIGSDSSCDLVLPSLQPQHALLSFRNSSHTVLRLYDSALVELSVQAEVPIQPGCHLRVGDLTFDLCQFNVGSCSQRGPRSTLEDTAKALQNLGICEDLPLAYFSVFDGHGGITCADYLSSHLHTFLRARLLSSPWLPSDVKKGVKQALIDTFQVCDEDYRRTNPGQTVGSTALVSLVLGDLLITGNLGDSRAVLCRAGRAIDLSVDHKAVTVR